VTLSSNTTKGIFGLDGYSSRRGLFFRRSSLVSCIFWGTVFLSLLNIYALREWHQCLFQTNPFVQPNFLLQPKKVGKKGRSMIIALHPTIRDFSRLASDVPDIANLDLHPCKLIY
jgi:hypothetical protein